MSLVRFTPSDLELFAAASHDRNPLHLSALYSRKTAIGEPVVFGMLSALAAFQELPARPGETLGSLSLTFRNPLLCHVDYQLTVLQRKTGQFKIMLEDAGRPMLTGQIEFQAGRGADRPIWCAVDDPFLEPTRHAVD